MEYNIVGLRVPESIPKSKKVAPKAKFLNFFRRNFLERRLEPLENIKFPVIFLDPLPDIALFGGLMPFLDVSDFQFFEIFSKNIILGIFDIFRYTIGINWYT